MVTIHRDPQVRILPFRYPLRAERASLRQRIFELIESEGFTRAGEEIQTGPIFEHRHLGQMKADMEENCGSKLGKMTEQTRRRITRSVRLTVVSFRQRRSEDLVIVRYCAANCYPCIGYELWAKVRPRLPAGFVEVRSKSRALRKRLTLRIREISGGP